MWKIVEFYNEKKPQNLVFWGFLINNEYFVDWVELVIAEKHSLQD